MIGDGAGSPRPLPHHRPCGPASGGSSRRRIETLPGLGEGQQAETVPVGIGQGHLKDPGASNPPVSVAAISPFTGVELATAWTGDFADAESIIAEIESVAAVTGSRLPPYALLRLRALQGREDEVSAAIERFGGQGMTATRALWATAVLNNGLARYAQAVSAARPAVSEAALNHWVFV